MRMQGAPHTRCVPHGNALRDEGIFAQNTAECDKGYPAQFFMWLKRC